MQTLRCLHNALTRPVRLLAGAAGGAALIATLGAAAAPSVHQGSVTNYAGALYGVTAISASDAWAVGNGSSTALHVLHWDGRHWAEVSVPHPGTLTNELNGVGAVSASDVWAVGAYYDNQVGQTLTEHWNGTSWTLVPSPSPGGTSMYGSVLESVSATSATDAWAVGYYSEPGSAAKFRGLILH